MQRHFHIFRQRYLLLQVSRRAKMQALLCTLFDRCVLTIQREQNTDGVTALSDIGSLL
jgi:hypothetical protein